MGNAADLLHPPAERYRGRVKLIRYTAEAVKSALLRHDLLDIAAEYDQLADSTERGHFGDEN
jgi:hypothetical protein